MIFTPDQLQQRIYRAMGYMPTSQQRRAIEVFASFLFCGEPSGVMLLRGSAGTGKTTLAAAVVRSLKVLRQKMVLLAPTGRAAKVFSVYSGSPAYTIHRRIYRQQSGGDLSAFKLGRNMQKDTLFIVDEASMISATPMSSPFGNSSTSLLDDLISFVYQGEGCRLMLIGDSAQLPPVGEGCSAALERSMLEMLGLQVFEANMDEVVRQTTESGILWNATKLRELALADGWQSQPVKLWLKGFDDIRALPGDELIEQLQQSFHDVGHDETIVITRSNKRANIYNRGMRSTVLDYDDELCRGDQLMIVRNNYQLPPALEEECGLSFLANGDRCVVLRVRHQEEVHGFRFADVTFTLPDYDNVELTMKTLLTTLTTEAPALLPEQQQQLYERVMADYADLPTKADRIKALKSDPYYNALQVKFGYAVTCHKAQGGQWAHVYIDQGYLTPEMIDADYLHWLYTAITRATEKVFLVNYKSEEF